MVGKLTARQERFVAEYLVDLNATQAAIRAGYKERSARQTAARMLTNDDIASAIASGKQKQAVALDLNATRVLAEIMRLAFVDVRKLFHEDGSLKPIQEWDSDVSAAVAAVDVVEMAGAAKIGGDDGLSHIPMYLKKVKLWDKRASLELLGKHLALFKERVEHTGLDGGPIQQVTRIERVILDGKSDAED